MRNFIESNMNFGGLGDTPPNCRTDELGFPTVTRNGGFAETLSTVEPRDYE